VLKLGGLDGIVKLWREYEAGADGPHMHSSASGVRSAKCKASAFRHRRNRRLPSRRARRGRFRQSGDVLVGQLAVAVHHAAELAAVDEEHVATAIGELAVLGVASRSSAKRTGRPRLDRLRTTMPSQPSSAASSISQGQMEKLRVKSSKDIVPRRD
jgi:hypothetical protein